MLPADLGRRERLVWCLLMRLAWSNPQPPPKGTGTPAPLVLLPGGTRVPQSLAPPRVNLALAIEAHLAGGDGLTDDEFVLLFATGHASGD
jgi:hypothetical protein